MAQNRFFTGMVDFFGDIRCAQTAARTYSNLSHLSDAQLSARGLSRDTLPQYAFASAHGER